MSNHPVIQAARGVLSFIGTMVGLLVLVLLITPLVVPPIYLELRGLNTQAEVIDKNETISMTATTWRRQLLVEVRYQPADADEPATAKIPVDTATYDRLQVKETTEVRYTPAVEQLGDLRIARFESQSGFGLVFAVFGMENTWVLLSIGGWLLLLFIWSKWQHWWLGLLVMALLLGAGLYFGSAAPPPTPPGPMLEAQARVGQTRHIDRVWGGRRTSAEDAVQPYDIVELMFVPQGARSPVVAVDIVDSGSVPQLETGSTVSIRYNLANPRFALIEQASRTYYWKNMRTFGIIAIILLVPGAFALWRYTQRSSRRATQAATS